MTIYKISGKTKLLFSVLFPVMLLCWNQGFDIGAFGSVLYRSAISAWVFAVSAFSALCYVALFERLSVRKRTFFILLVPVLWPLIDYVDHHVHNVYIHYFVLFDYVIVIFGLLYAAYVFLRLIKPDIFEPLSLGNKLFIVLFALLFSCLGYFAGIHNAVFLECAHFELSGDYVPHNCRKPQQQGTDYRTLHRAVW